MQPNTPCFKNTSRYKQFNFCPKWINLRTKTKLTYGKKMRVILFLQHATNKMDQRKYASACITNMYHDVLQLVEL